jgi:hypothetical protein
MIVVSHYPYPHGQTVLQSLGDVSGVQAGFRAVGGCWEMAFTVTANAATSSERLINFAKNSLQKYAINNDWGWFGKIVRVDIAYGYVKMSYDMTSKYANRVWVAHETGITTPRDNDEQVNLYGYWDYVHKNSKITDASPGWVAGNLANKIRDKRSNSIPYAIGVNSEPVANAIVQFTAWGLLPLSARYASGVENAGASIGYMVPDPAGALLYEVLDGIIEGDTDKSLTATNIATHDPQITRGELKGDNAWARIESLVKWESDTGWEIDCDIDGRVTYRPAPTAEQRLHVIYPGGIYSTASGKVSSKSFREVKPGWYKDSVTADVFYVDEVILRDDSDFPELRVSGVDVDVFLYTGAENDRVVSIR